MDGLMKELVESLINKDVIPHIEWIKWQREIDDIRKDIEYLADKMEERTICDMKFEEAKKAKHDVYMKKMNGTR